MPKRAPQFRVNIVVTEEQHSLLVELASLDPSVRSSAGFVRELLDQVTPLLRKTVPLMRAAAEELEQGRNQLKEPLRQFLGELHQLDLLDASAPGRQRPQRSEDVPPVRRRSRRVAK